MVSATGDGAMDPEEIYRQVIAGTREVGHWAWLRMEAADLVAGEYTQDEIESIVLGAG